MQASRAVLFGVLIVCWCESVAGVDSSAALIVSEAESNEDTEQSTSVLKKKVPDFVPTHEWQEILEDQAIPPGLDISMNLWTGVKMARLLPEDQKVGIQAQNAYQVTTDGAVQDPAVHNTIPAPTPDPEHAAPAPTPAGSDTGPKISMLPEADEHIDVASQEEYQRERSELYFKTMQKKLSEVPRESDVEKMKRIAAILHSNHTSNYERAEALAVLVDLVDDIDNANDLYTIGGFIPVVRSLSSEDVTVQMNAAWALGTLVQSNPKTQVQALELGAITPVMQLLQTSTDSAVLAKCLFAISALIRTNPAGQEVFYRYRGLEVLRRVFEAEGYLAVQKKVVTLLGDLIEEDQQSRGLPARLVQEGWCRSFVNLLTTPDNDFREKIFVVMNLVINECKQEFREHGQAQLLALANEWASQRSENEFVEELAQQLDLLRHHLQ